MSEELKNLPPDALRDFEIECEEHIFAARQTLVSLESVLELALVDHELLDTLFRAFHSIKGLSGMVGAQSIERTAHELETFLVAVKNGKLSLSEEGLDVLQDAVALLETSCAAFVAGKPPIDMEALEGRIALVLSAQATESASPATVPQTDAEPTILPGQKKQLEIEAALLRGERVWRVIFKPSPQLSTQGIKVNTIRETLRSLGEIIIAEPITTAGGVEFHFVVSTASDTDPSASFGDGVTIAPYESIVPKQEVKRQTSPTSQNAKLVRVELSRLDDLMRSVADLVITRGRLQRGLSRAGKYLPSGERRELEEATEAIEQQLRQLREGIMRVRMVPIRDLFVRMRLVIRDLTRESGKQLELVFEGEETEVDKLLVDRMADPLLHLIRNAVSHGIEDAEERLSAGKSPKGRIVIRAAATGGMILLEVEDDGRGVQVDEVFAKARVNGLIVPTAVADPAAVLDLLCSPGLSTRETADRISGRGVGMDIVRFTVESLGGTLALDSRPGVGTRFICRLPLTLMVADVLTISAGGQTYAVSKTLIREVVPVVTELITVTESHELIPYRGGVLPMLRLSDLFGTGRPSGEFVALITGEGTSAVALAIDRAMGLHEVVVRALEDSLIQVPGFSGATDLGDGHPILILDPVGLTRITRQRHIARPAKSRG